MGWFVFTARCTIVVQSAILRLHVSLSVCDVGWSGPHRLEILENNCSQSITLLYTDRQSVVAKGILKCYAKSRWKSEGCMTLCCGAEIETPYGTRFVLQLPRQFLIGVPDRAYASSYLCSSSDYVKASVSEICWSVREQTILCRPACRPNHGLLVPVCTVCAMWNSPIRRILYMRNFTKLAFSILHFPLSHFQRPTN